MLAVCIGHTINGKTNDMEGLFAFVFVVHKGFRPNSPRSKVQIFG